MELIDFQLETYGDPAFYAEVMKRWGRAGFGVIGKCPDCGNRLLFTATEKKAVVDAEGDLPVLQEDWYSHAFVG
jgi:hypothetical protein